MWDETKDPETKAEEVMSKYRRILTQLGLPYAGSCPVREKDGSGIKYYITFCSRHPHALLLMNDAMCSAYQQRMHEAAMEGTLFAKSDWKEARPAPTGLAQIVCDMLRKSPGKSRADLWLEIVTNHFMRYTTSEYKRAVADLHKNGTVIFKDIKGTRRLNDQAMLSLAPLQARYTMSPVTV
jgi:hypothetical protein